MRIEDCYAQKFGVDATRNQPLQSTAAGSSASFFDTLKDCGKAPEAAQATAETTAGQTSAAPSLEAGSAPVRVVDVEAEFGLTLANGMSPEAIEKQTQLLERLDKLCADNPGVYYRLNPAVFQKMADDPDLKRPSMRR